MRCGSLSAAEDITGHKHETIGRWLRAAAQHAEQITDALVRDLHLTVVEVDAGSGQVLSDSDWLYSTMNQRVTNSCISKDLENDKVFRT